MYIARWLRRLALRCALMPVPRASRARIADELEEEYTGVATRRHALASGLWFARECASIFGWYLLQRLRLRRPLRSFDRASGSKAMSDSHPASSRRPRAPMTLGHVARDARIALRGMRHGVGFTLLAVAVLAVGIGANAAVFSIFNWVLLSDSPGVGAPEGLVTLRFGDDKAIYSVPHSLSVDLRERTETLSGLTAYLSISAQVARPGSERAARIPAELVTATFFDVLEVDMASGRGFRAEEGTDPASARVAVISTRMQRRWFPDGDAVGNEILISGTPFEVIGIAPAGFHGPEHPGDTDLWMTQASHDASLPHWSGAFDRSGGVWLSMIGRLRPAVSREIAQQELTALIGQIAEEYGDDGGFRRFEARLTAGTGQYGVRQRAAATLRIMSAVVAVLLLLACANVANMVLARATGRERELAVRRALGATRTRLVTQLLVENTMLAALGGAAAVAVSFAIVAMFEGARVVSWMPALRDVPVNLPVLGFAVLLSLLTGVLFGLAPALTASRPSALRRDSAAGSRLRDSLVVAQLALSVTLFVGAGLLTRTLVNMRAIDVGIERDNLVFFSIDPALQGYDEERSRGLIERVAANLEALPTTRSVAASFPEAFGRMLMGATVARWGEDIEEAGITPDNMRVTPEFFDTMGIDIVEGRTFDGGRLVESEPARREVILSEALADDLFPDGSAIGRLVTIREWNRDEPVPYEVVGVARDARLRRLLDDQADVIYEPFGQRYFPQQASFQVRISGDAREVLDQVREAMLAADPVLPMFDLVTATDKLDGTIAEHRMVAKLSAVLATMALLLAGVGIYGVVATTVRKRFREIGIRMALGARSRDVLGGVLRHFVGLGLLGVVLGLVGAAWLMGLMRSRLYGVEPFDPPVFVAGAVVMLLLTVIASLVPARHATRVSPVDVLREE